MPKTIINETVLHDWVCSLTFQMQALLLTAMRGPDENNKYNAAKAIIRYLRGVVIKPAGDWRLKNDNDFMWGEYKLFFGYSNAFWADHDEYPHHFIMHLVHCAEVVGYKHPDTEVRKYWLTFYKEACHAFHMNPETETQMHCRLNDFGCGIHATIETGGGPTEQEIEAEITRRWNSIQYNPEGTSSRESHREAAVAHLINQKEGKQ